jgi:ribulose kinase
MYLLGYDIGSSFIKASLLDANTGKLVAAASAPAAEMGMIAHQPGWAEQHPDTWWENAKVATAYLRQRADLKAVKAIGISYQMHGLVVVDKNTRCCALRSSGATAGRCPSAKKPSRPGSRNGPVAPAQLAGQLYGLQAALGAGK